MSSLFRISIRGLSNYRVSSTRLYSSKQKLSTDEKFIIDVLTEEPDEDVVNSREASYRRKSSLSKFQNTSNDKSETSSDKPLPIGPKYWKSKFRQSYRKVEKGLTSPLSQYVKQNMEVIESYNQKHKKTMEDRIKLDLSKKFKWEDVITNYGLRMAVVRHLLKKNRGKLSQTELTNFQQRYFALMSGYGSTIAKGPSGSGKSFAMLISALSLRRSNFRGRGINSLLIVKSNTLVLQYQNIINGIVSQMANSDKFDKRSIAQFLYRGTPEEELQQEDDLTDFQTPHILITTPQRLLDILSSKGMDFVKINSLSFIGVDDFNTMLDEDMLLETEKKSPIVMLMDYVLKLQDYRRHHNEPHPQIVLVTDDSTTMNLIEQVKEYTKWIDWSKFAKIGNFTEEEDIPFYKYVSDKHAVSTVLAHPKVSASGKLKINLFDMHPFEYGKTPSQWLDVLYRKDFGNSLVHKKQRNKKWTNMPVAAKDGALEILCSGMGKLLKKPSVIDWLNIEKGIYKNALVVHPDEVNSSKIVEILKSKTGKNVRILDIVKDGNIFAKDRKINNSKDTETELLVINSSSLIGLTLRDLDTIFILGTNTIKSTSHFAKILGRSRASNGLIPNEQFSLFSRVKNDDSTGPDFRTFIIHPMLPDYSVEPLERNFLERSFILNGLVKQLPVVGVPERWENENADNYERAINGASVEDYNEHIRNENVNGDKGGLTEFGGIHTK